MSDKELMILGAVVGVAFLLLPKIAKAAAQTVATVPGAIIEGGVKGVGSSFGIPDTEMSQCQKDVAAGRTWEASFSCPAADFIKYAFGIGQ